MILYISGPMTGHPEFNYPAFHAAETKLRDAGHTVLNPARQPKQATWEDYMRADIAAVVSADGVALLPGWRTSRGARLEHHVAAELGLEIKDLVDWLTW
jgi:Domain of unknown function (DUF4406)